MSEKIISKNTVITITSGTFFRAFLALILIAVLYYLRDLAAVILFSVVIASGIEPAVMFLGRRRIPRVFVVILVFLSFLAFLGIIVYLIIPPLFKDLSDFVSLAPIYLDQTFGPQGIGKIFPGLPLFISRALLDVATFLKISVQNFTNGSFTTITQAFGGVVSFALLVIFSFYLAVQEKGVENFLRIVTPSNREKYILDLWRRSREKIGIWAKGQILLGLLVGVLTFLGLLILKVDFPLPLAILAGLLELIPLFGPILAAIPAIAIALLQNPTLALYTLALYAVIQQFENHLIYPLVVRRIIGVPPMIVILALVIGGRLGGLFGLLLAVPVATVLMEFVSDIEAKKRMASENNV